MFNDKPFKPVRHDHSMLIIFDKKKYDLKIAREKICIKNITCPRLIVDEIKKVN